jgi:mannosyltransferase
LLAAVGAGLRLWQSQESLWADELHTAWCAVGTLSEVCQRAAIGNYGPLYFWLEWALVRLMGAAELTLRLVSILAGSLLPLAVYGLARRWLALPRPREGRGKGGLAGEIRPNPHPLPKVEATAAAWIGVVAAALVVVDPLSIFFATEARPYALVQLLAVIHVGVLAELTIGPRAQRGGLLRVAFVLGAAVLFHLHYTAALLIVAELLWWGLLCWGRPNAVHYRWTALLVDLGCLAVLCLPAAGNVSRIFARRELWAAFVPQRSLWEVLELLPWSIAGLVLLAGMVIAAAGNRPTNERVVALRLLVLCWLFVPLGLAWLATTADVARLFFPRYLAASAPAAILAAAMCVELVPGRLFRFAGGVALVAWAAWSSGIAGQLSTDGRVNGSRQENWRAAVAWLNEQLPRQPYPVLVASGLIEADELRQPHNRLLDDYCLAPVTGLYRLQVERANLVPLTYHNPGKLLPPAAALVADRGGAWLVVRGNAKRAEQVAADVQKSAVRSQGSGVRGQAEWTISRAESFGAVQVLLIERQSRAGASNP